MSKIIIGSARIGETGGYNQKAGDGTGREVSTQEYYNHEKGWVVLRAKNETHRKRLAEAMIKACNNNMIGYDMNGRLSALSYLNTHNIKDYDLSKITNPVEVDCSSLVRLCIAYATGKLLGNFTTGNEKNVLLQSGLFRLANDALQVGDVLVTKTKGHTVIVTSITENSNVSEQKPKYKGNSIVDALKSINVDTSYANRKRIAKLNGINDYKGTYEQNVIMLKLFKRGKLRWDS